MNKVFKSKLSAFLTLLLFCLQSAYATSTTPTSDFIDNQDGTLTHKITGLTWMRCAMGQRWTGATCSGSAINYTHDQVLSLTSNFAGHSDWRVPNIAELNTIVERENYSPSINTILFPNAPTNWFWSSSLYVSAPVGDWAVNFNDGKNGGLFFHYFDSNGLFHYNYTAIRLVRGGQRSFEHLTPTSDFIDNQDGTLTHKITGLTWMRCAMGQRWTGATCSGSAINYTHDQVLSLTSNFAGHSDWRVPNQNELLSIVEYGAYNPAINTTLFPNTPTDWFWSSSLDSSRTNYWWVVNFKVGTENNNAKNGSFAVRLVRNKQSISSLPLLVIETTRTTNQAILISHSGTGDNSSNFHVSVFNTTGTWYVLTTNPESIVASENTPVVFILGPYQTKEFDAQLMIGQKLGWHAISPLGAFYALTNNPYPAAREVAIAAFTLFSIDILVRGLFTVELPPNTYFNIDTLLNTVDDIVAVIGSPVVDLAVEVFNQSTTGDINLLSPVIWRYIHSLKAVSQATGPSLYRVISELFGEDTGKLVLAKLGGINTVLDLANIFEKYVLLKDATNQVLNSPPDDYIEIRAR